jgi:bifunctional DNA-binding transcriptional regulator/antitoxin component of YhaV-PrlF toxin-antitoxin module
VDAAFRWPSIGALPDESHGRPVRLITVAKSAMALAQSKLTAQGQIPAPASVRKRLGVSPGSVLEWHDDGEQVVVRRRRPAMGFSDCLVLANAAKVGHLPLGTFDATLAKLPGTRKL